MTTDENNNIIGYPKPHPCFDDNDRKVVTDVAEALLMLQASVPAAEPPQTVVDENNNSLFGSVKGVADSSYLIVKGVRRRRRPKTRRIRRFKGKKSSYECDVCHKVFRTQSCFTVHMRIHTGVRPYHCRTCNRRFMDNSSFVKHKRVHSGEQPYACPVCEKCFTQSGNMYRHALAKHNWVCERRR